MSKDHNRLIEQEGVSYFAFKCSKLKYLFRNEKDHDKGIDGDIELTEALNISQKRIGVQVKSRTNPYTNKQGKISINVTEENLEQWKTSGRPVILVLYINEDRPVYWTRVDNVKSTSIILDTKQVFDKGTQKDLIKILTQYYHRMSINVSSYSKVMSEIGFYDLDNEVIKEIEDKLYNAYECINRKEFNSAYEIFYSLLRTFSSNYLLKYNTGVCALEIGEIDTAFDLASQLYDEYPTRFESYELLGNAYAYIRNYESAEIFLEKAIILDNNNSSVWNSVGLLGYWQNQCEKALQAFQKSIQLEEDATVYFNMALCNVSLGEMEKALDCYDKAILLNDNFYDAYNNKGLLLTTLFRLEEAKESFYKALEINNTRIEAYANLGNLLKDLNENTLAIDIFYKALLIESNLELCHSSLALLFCRLSEYSKAQEHFSKCKVINTKKSAACYVDIGFECAFIIKLKNNTSINVIDISELALFNRIPSLRQKNTGNEDNDKINYIKASMKQLQYNIRNNIDMSKINNKKKLKNKDKGIWFFASITPKNSPLEVCKLAIFAIQDSKYFIKIRKEIIKQLKINSKYSDIQQSIIEYDGRKYNGKFLTYRDLLGLTSLRIFKRITGEISFYVKFGTYTLSGIMTSNDIKTLNGLKNTVKYKLPISIAFTSFVDGVLENLTIEDICDIHFDI